MFSESSFKRLSSGVKRLVICQYCNNHFDPYNKKIFPKKLKIFSKIDIFQKVNPNSDFFKKEINR